MNWKKLSALILAFCMMPARAEQIPAASVVLGSFSSRAGAARAIDRYQGAIDLGLEIHRVDTNNIVLFRVMTTADTELADVNKALQRIRNTLIPDAWLLRTFVDVYEEMPEQIVARDEDPAPLAVVPQPTITSKVVPATPAILPAPSKKPTGSNAGEPIVLAKLQGSRVILDGRLDEAAWQRAPLLDTFFVVEPDTIDKARYQSEVKMFYTDKGLYIGTLNQQPAETLVPRLSSRDSEINRDGISITLDTSGEGLYGLWFGINLGGSLIDGTVLPEKQFSVQWDGPWEGESAVTDSGYSTEMFLPWSMMAMPDTEGDRRMGIYARRRVAHIDEEWGFPALPQTGSKLMSALQPIEMRGVRPSPQFAVFPFSAATYNNIAQDTTYRVGSDIFWRPSTNLQLTATLNPDFGAIESDDVVVNLTAFETFFPEKRLFFLEGSDVFVTTPRSNIAGQNNAESGRGARRSATSFRGEPTTLVNTRRIGGTPIEPATPAGVTISEIQLGQPTDLLGAVKLTGQQGALRYGVLAASEEDTKFKGTDPLGNPVRVEQSGRDFGILRFLHENTTKGRRSLGWITTAVTHDNFDAFVHGIDLHYQSLNRSWNWDGQLMYSDVDDVEGFGGLFDLTYIPSRGVLHRISFDYLDDKLDIDDMGFIRRNDSINFRYSLNLTNSNLKRLRSRANSFFLSQEYNTDGKAVRSGLFWRSSYTFQSRNAINTQLAYFPRRWDDRNSEGNGAYRIDDRLVGELAWGTDSSKKISISLFAGAQQEELSDWTYSGRIGVTFKPNDRFSFDLDADYMRRHGWLLHQDGREFTTFDTSVWQPRLSMDLFLTSKQQLRLTMQWVGIRADEQDFYLVPLTGGDLLPDAKLPGATTDDFAISRITAQVRYRWEIAPLSDLFIVYTRGSNYAVREDDFNDLFHDALVNPVLDFFVIKLRYRFGN